MSSTNIIQLCVGRTLESDGGAYLDRVVALAYEQGFPLYGLFSTKYDDGTVHRCDELIRGLSRGDFDAIIGNCRECYEDAERIRRIKNLFDKPNKTFNERLNDALEELLFN